MIRIYWVWQRTTSWRIFSTYLLEFIKGPTMRLSGPMSRKICGGDIGDSFSIDTDDLGLLAFVVVYNQLF
jgi:hypothetical protein